ncbi:connector enhancer of kinase suppressor of ras 1 isoform X2 [Ornithorhynchus anatinus]|uniref:connector enhancer of kinase suppressor of ras 1 isoform X2 n=1 Tax=Ornithorhynchus anatinus TaxID=9258 RepID=UPI0019D46120|nr:connector enhancer of kinase suppressor of ras 1 isoform X2 [Ornithorhynchus anatinus]
MNECKLGLAPLVTWAQVWAGPLDGVTWAQVRATPPPPGVRPVSTFPLPRAEGVMEAVSGWSPGTVAAWLRGLDESVQGYPFEQWTLTGQTLLQLTYRDLETLGVHRVGHQELILEGVEHLYALSSGLETENLQSLTTHLRVVTHTLHGLVQNPSEGSVGTLPPAILSCVVELVRAAWDLFSWLNRYLFCQLNDYSACQEIVGLCAQLEQTLHEDSPEAEKETHILTICSHVAAICDTILGWSPEELLRQRAQLQPVALTPSRPLACLGLQGQGLCGTGIEIHSTSSGRHFVSGISPEFLAGDHCPQLLPGDEIIQVNGQVVVGWTQSNLVRKLLEDPAHAHLLLKNVPVPDPESPACCPLPGPSSRSPSSGPEPLAHSPLPSSLLSAHSPSPEPPARSLSPSSEPPTRPPSPGSEPSARSPSPEPPARSLSPGSEPPTRSPSPGSEPPARSPSPEPPARSLSFGSEPPTRSPSPGSEPSARSPSPEPPARSLSPGSEPPTRSPSPGSEPSARSPSPEPPARSLSPGSEPPTRSPLPDSELPARSPSLSPRSPAHAPLPEPPARSLSSGPEPPASSPSHDPELPACPASPLPGPPSCSPSPELLARPPTPGSRPSTRSPSPDPRPPICSLSPGPDTQAALGPPASPTPRIFIFDQCLSPEDPVFFGEDSSLPPELGALVFDTEVNSPDPETKVGTEPEPPAETLGSSRRKPKGVATRLSRRRVSCRDLGRADCDGWLLRKKDHAGFMAQKWRRCWVVLKGHTLYWYSHPQDEKAEGLINVSNYSLESRQEQKKKYVFQLTHEVYKPFVFAADTLDDLSMWVSHLVTSISKYQAPNLAVSQNEEDCYSETEAEDPDEEIRSRAGSAASGRAQHLPRDDSPPALRTPRGSPGPGHRRRGSPGHSQTWSIDSSDVAMEALVQGLRQGGVSLIGQPQPVTHEEYRSSFVRRNRDPHINERIHHVRALQSTLKAKLCELQVLDQVLQDPALTGEKFRRWKLQHQELYAEGPGGWVLAGAGAGGPSNPSPAAP